ncbi:MAG: sulfopyruvate decarboxylase subunit beta [Methanobrevibacter sp.]|jgi:sulfopyruvate decarboxylase subunit beta|nr:sulfopyruvate decarboxylase subunit beta [Candidatus Methanovirga basalitermitum]
MRRYDAIKSIMEHITNEIVVANIGFPSRELYEIKDRNRNFYMIGSMGLASSIGLGLALSQEEKTIIIDGDGSILMNLGSLVTIANQNPDNLILIIIDNHVYGSTGNQPTYTQNINLLRIAKSIGFKNSHDFNKISFKDILTKKQTNSTFIHYKTSSGNANVEIIDLTPESIKKRFMNSIK